jgi:farnesyl diphosphate synthase
MTVAASFDDWMQVSRARVEDALARWSPADAPAGLGQAMRYAALGGGKRLRALLTLAASESVRDKPEAGSQVFLAGAGSQVFLAGAGSRVFIAGAGQGANLDEASHAAFDEAALRAACAVELIHAYSLVHDDLPCMDNDVLRRGQPTAHVKFGEAQAMLAGDALQALAFELLCPADAGIPDQTQAQLCRLLAQAAGAQGMAGGQAIDLASVGQPLTEPQLGAMHARKTGALLRASVCMGAACRPGGIDGLPEAAAQSLERYGAALGLAFQVVDDILDVTADAATLGKTAGKDAASDKPTYVSVLGLAASRQLAQDLYQEALAALNASGLPDTARLAALAGEMVNRAH